MKKKVFILSATIGHALEAYDLTLCAYLSLFISKTYFPHHTVMHNLVSFYLVFLIGYLARPLGGILYGMIGDLKGRKKAFQGSIILMGLSTASLAFIPNYNELGIASTLLFVLFRTLQCISAGGEYVVAKVFLLEHSSPQKRGAICSWINASTNAGVLIASLASGLVTYLISIHYFSEWVWRSLFVFSIPGAILGFWLSNRTRETLEFLSNQPNFQNKRIKSLTKDISFFFKYEKELCLISIAITWLSACLSFIIFVYGPIHLVKANHLTSTQALFLNSFSLLLLVILVPVFGKLSDTYGRKPLLIFPAIFFIFFSYPYFYYLSYGNINQIALANLCISIPTACFFATGPITVTEILPSPIRCTAVALLYSIPASVFGGTAPLVALKLCDWTELKIAPAFYLIFCAALTLIFVLRLKEPILAYNKNNSVLLTELKV